MTDPTLARRPGPMPLLPLLDEALRRTRACLPAIFWSVALPLAVLRALLTVFQAVTVRSQVSGVPDLQRILIQNGEILLLAVVVGFISAIAYTAGQAAALDGLTGRPIDMRRAWRFALQPRVWGTLFLVGLALAGALIVCVLPIFYVAPLLSFVTPVMVEEGRFSAAALSRSAELTRYNPTGRLSESPIAKLLVVMLVTTLITILASWLVSLPFQLPMLIDLFRKSLNGGQDPQALVARWIWLQVPATFLTTLVATAVYLYSSVAVGMLFFDVRDRKEGVDLRSEIDAVFPASPSTMPPPLPPTEPWR
jgi:hypothetical protein